MVEEQTSSSRSEDRHNHICIGLRYCVNDQWERLDALGWNEVGFNFYSAHEIHDPLLLLKRGFTRFEGTIVWQSLHTSDEVVLAELVNELIYKKAKDVINDVALRARLLKLIRAPGMLEGKRSLLASLGLDMSDAEMAELTTQRRLEHPMFRYGVKLESEAWRAIVKKAFNISSVVISMEKWADAFPSK